MLGEGVEQRGRPAVGQPLRALGDALDVGRALVTLHDRPADVLLGAGVERVGEHGSPHVSRGGEHADREQDRPAERSTVPDLVFAHPRLATVYDALDPDRRDLEPYLAVVEELAATRRACPPRRSTSRR